MRPLKNVYSGASELLSKARRDRDLLRLAADAGDEVALRDKLFDFSVTVYHVLDWIKSFHPHLKTDAYTLLDGTPALSACRDIANSNKHFDLDLALPAYRSHPPTVEEVDYSATPPVSTMLASNSSQPTSSDFGLKAPVPRRMKVVLRTGERARVEDIADDAISAWESFFAQHGLAP